VTDCDGKSVINTNDYLCSKCHKKFKSRNGLWCHSKKCTVDVSLNVVTENPVIDTNLIMKLIQQNENLQNLLMQQSNEKTELINKLVEREPGNNNNNTINGNVTNNNNNKFNLNFFLNETCKDAMNIKEFMENIRITFNDLLKIGNEGFVNGVSDIFIKQLQDLDVSKRPIHCTDSKRETIYFKEDDVWNKDDKDKTRLKQLIERVEYRNVAALRDWCNENPDAKVNNTPNNLLKDKIYFQTLQGDERTRDKIIKNMVKQITVEKE
jgi:antitoxin component HigA of HigAB toxin-antitoxin module